MYNTFSYKPLGQNKAYFIHVIKNKNELARSIKTNLCLKDRTALYIVDRNLPLEYKRLVAELLDIKKNNVVLIDPSAKIINKPLPIYDALVKTKPDIAVVIGGGTTGDFSGFACATYQRGIPRIYFPTTTLSMIDASIGGKSGIDHLHIKNSLSVRHYPEHVFMYMPFLNTLPSEEFGSGFAETVKLGVIANPSLLSELKGFTTGKTSLRKLQSIVFNSCKTKAHVCEQQKPVQATLLYGHAIGHAIEGFSSSRMRHGDCVSIGMNIEGAIACVLGIWNFCEWMMQRDILNKLKLPLDIPGEFSLNALIKGMSAYKKLTTGKEHLFILPETFGRMHSSSGPFLTAIDKKDMIKILQKALKWINTNKHVRN